MTMKYPWTAFSLIIIWIATTYTILRVPVGELNVNIILLLTLVGTIIISFIGFRAPRLKK